MTEALTVGGYELKNCVATGSTTQIWEVNEPGSTAQLAMKLMLDDVRKNGTERGVLRHEFRVGKSLEHPMFLQFYTIEINRDHSFFIMDFFRSPSLKNHITSNLPGIQSSFKKLAQSLAQAYDYMHGVGWLHRDIKPDNILVNRAGEARIIDFSLATRIKGKLGKMLSGKSKSIQGTRTYIAPETILRKPATPQTDMYSLGVTLFEVLVGAPPFAGDSPNALLKKHLSEPAVAPSVFNNNVTKELDRIILRLLSKQPEKRYESMQELERAFQGLQCFVEDPLELRDRKVKEAKELQAQSVDQRLDSRADAERVAKGIKAPVAPKKKPRVNPALLREEEERLAREKAKQQGGAGQPMPGQHMQPGTPMPMYPGMPMQPGMGMPPGMPYPGMPMQPGMAYPGMPQGQPMPGYPQQPYPGQPMPQGQPMPGQAAPPMPPGAPQQPPPQQQQPPAQQPQQPPAPQPAQPQQPAPQPPQPQPEPAAAEDLPEATLDDFAIE